MSEISELQVYPLMNPSSAPFKGMSSTLNPASLGLGEFVKAANVRGGRRSLKVRWGNAKKTSSALATGTLKGAWSGMLNGTVYLIAAYRTASETRVYKVDTAAWTASEITAASGEFGNSRFATDGLLSFAVIRDRSQLSPGDLLVIQNGTDSPRVYDPSSSYTSKVSVHSAITPPTQSAQFHSMPTFPAYWSPKNAANTTYVNSTAAKFEGTDDSASATENFIILTVKSGAAISAETVDIAMGGNCSFASSRQLVMLVETTSLTFWDNMSVELYNGSYVALTSSQAVFVPLSGSSSRFLVAVPLDDKIASLATTCTKIRFTYSGPDPGTNETFKIYMIAAGGGLQGGCLHGISYRSIATRAESIGQILPVRSARITDLGGPTLDGARLPIHPWIYYRYTLSFSQTASATYVDDVMVYRADPLPNGGLESSLSHLGQNGHFTLTTYAAGWAFSTGSARSILTKNDDGAYAKDYSLSLPDGANLPIPIGSSMISVGTRLYVGGTYNQFTALDRSRVLISQDHHPWRFRAALKFNRTEPTIDGATGVTFPGESVIGFATVSGSLLNGDSVVVFTNRGVWTLSGVDSYSLSRPTKVMLNGALLSRCITEYQNTLYWLDDRKQVRRWGGGSPDSISRNAIEDGISAATLTNSSMVFYNDLLYLAVLPSGGTNYTTVYVWDDLNQIWVMDELAAGNVAQFLPHFTGTSQVLYALTDDGHVYQYETPTQTQDGTSDITITLTPGEIHNDMWEPVLVGAVGIVCTDINTILTVTRTFKKDNAVVSGTIDLTTVPVGEYAYRWDQTTAGNEPQGAGVSCTVSLTGAAPGGEEILSLVARVGGIAGGPDVA